MRLPPVFMCVCFFADDIFEASVPVVAAIIARAAAVAATRARVDALLAVAPTRARAVVVGQTRARKTAVGLAPSLASTSLVPASTRARPPWPVLVAFCSYLGNSVERQIANSLQLAPRCSRFASYCALADSRPRYCSRS